MTTLQENPLALQIREAQVNEADAVALQQTLEPFFQEAEMWRAKARSIQVTSEDDKDQMKAARETRLALKEIRVNVEKARVRLKEESLRKGKAIDGVANFLKSLITPIEEYLQQQEDFVKLLEEKAKQELKLKRTAELAPFLPAFEDVGSVYDLANMPEETYAKLLETSALAAKLAKEAADKIESDRIEKEKADAEERERMRIENDRLKKEAEAKQAEIEQERVAKQAAEAALRMKQQEEQRIEADKRLTEQKRIEEEQRILRAPDREKLVQLADSIAAIQMPIVSSDEAQTILKNAIDLLSKASQYVRTQSLSI